MLEKDISASKPKLHESRGEEANADREKLQAALHKMKTTPGYIREDAIDERIAFFEYQIWMESTTLKPPR